MIRTFAVKKTYLFRRVWWELLRGQKSTRTLKNRKREEERPQKSGMFSDETQPTAVIIDMQASVQSRLSIAVGPIPDLTKLLPENLNT
jgi:hypothetical protein